jgi:hypothetical protein
MNKLYTVPSPQVNAFPGNAGNPRDAAMQESRIQGDRLANLIKPTIGGTKRKRRRRRRRRSRYFYGGGGNIQVNMPQVLFKDPSAGTSQGLQSQISQLTNSTVKSGVNSEYDSMVKPPQPVGGGDGLSSKRRNRRKQYYSNKRRRSKELTLTKNSISTKLLF